MEWTDLKFFLAVARAGSLTDASRALQTSPATVSRRIVDLERDLGVRLFDRRQTGYVLTSTGEVIRTKALKVEEAALAVQLEARGRDIEIGGKVRVATTDDIGSLVIAPYLHEFRRRYPNVALEIVAHQEQVNLTRREADIALRPARPTQANYVIRQVGQWELALYAARSYADAHDLRPGIRNLSKADIITWTAEGAHFRGGPWMAKYARNSNLALGASTRRIHYAACKAGVGVAILPCLAADNDGDLIQLVPPRRVASIPLWLVVHRNLARTPRIRAAMEFLADAAAKTRSRTL